MIATLANQQPIAYADRREGRINWRLVALVATQAHAAAVAAAAAAAECKL